MDYAETLIAANKSRDAFMTSSKSTDCISCDVKILPQDDWLPGIPEFNIETGEFEYPAVTYHADCQPISGAW